jgi:hypothetical protein
MSTNADATSKLERETRKVLEESLTHIDARTRSRLNQARQAALAAAAVPRRAAWRTRGFMPASGAVAAAVLVALIMFGHQPQPTVVVSEPTLDVLDLVADDEALSLMEDEDHAFYEWAAGQGDSAGGSSDAQATG